MPNLIYCSSQKLRIINPPNVKIQFTFLIQSVYNVLGRLRTHAVVIPLLNPTCIAIIFTLQPHNVFPYLDR